MTFAKLSEYFEKLENTSSRLTLIDILSELFSEVTPLEIDKIIYLTQGRVAPFYAPVEIGMADKMVTQALALAFGETKESVWEMYQKIGDMGLVALRLCSRHHKRQTPLTVSEVFEKLLEIASVKGEGSVEKKITALKDMLVIMDDVSCKHLVRIPLGKTRLGIGDPTILDSLALAKLQDRGKRKLLEKAYNETSDLGLIGKTLFKGGLSEVQKLTVSVGRPIRSELCERLPSPIKVFEKMGDTVHASLKFDGFRVQIHKNGDKVTMYSRNLEEMTHMFPELIIGTLKQVKAKTAILDSEALAYQPESEEFLPFQETTKRRRKYNIEQMAESLPLKAFVFDILYVEGESLIDKPLTERMEALKRVVHDGETLLPASGRYLHKPQDLQFMLDEAISQGLEGVVVKRPDSTYEAGGRNFNWVKLKRHSSGDLEDTIDCVILGYIYGKGKRTAFGAGALLVGVYDKKEDKFVTVTKLGTGLTDIEWQSIKEKTKGLELNHKPARVSSVITPSVWVEPKIVIEVLADEITRSPLHTAGAVITDGVKEPGYALRFPRLISFRDQDKKAEDATTVEELISIYNDQGKKKQLEIQCFNMQFVSDLHLHSKYSRAVSPRMTLPVMAQYAVQKGLNILSASDFTHPSWFKEIKESLVESAEGLYTLKNDAHPRTPYFLLSTEISSIYKQADKLRRIHNLIFVPSLEVSERLTKELVKRGCNLNADGRPIIGLSSKHLLELILSIDERSILVPCHIWTPHFGVYGSASGFDSLHDCFEELSEHIYAIETGLSSDPDMNWQIKELQARTIVSFSDAHSPEKMGREATVFDLSAPNYTNVRNAIMFYTKTKKEQKKNSIPFTVEFYPEEGKYHFSGHRKCKVVFGPEEIRRLGNICPHCNSRLTEGVLYRVEQLSDKKFLNRMKVKLDDNGVLWYTDSFSIQPPYVKLVPLLEIIAKATRSTVANKKVQMTYALLCRELDDELSVLLRAPLLEIQKFAGENVASAVRKVRSGEILIAPGYDGEYGKVSIPQDMPSQLTLPI